MHATTNWKVRDKATDTSFSHSADAPFFTHHCEPEEGTKYMLEENAFTFEVNVIPFANVGELVPPPHYNFRHPRRMENSENTNICRTNSRENTNYETCQTA